MNGDATNTDGYRRSLRRYLICLWLFSGVIAHAALAGESGDVVHPCFTGAHYRILAIEYLLTDRFSLLLTRTDPGTAKTGVERGWSFDVRIRQSR